MQWAEERIAKRCIRDLLAAGYRVSVFDSEEVALDRSTDRNAIFAAMGTVDDEYLIAYTADGERAGWVRFIYGNDGPDVINDYSTGLEKVLVATNALAEKLDR